jgi:hypothetical protein
MYGAINLLPAYAFMTSTGVTLRLLQTTLPVPTHLEETFLHKEQRINMDTHQISSKTINIQKGTTNPDIDVDISKKTVHEGDTACPVTNVVSDNTAH